MNTGDDKRAGKWIDSDVIMWVHERTKELGIYVSSHGKVVCNPEKDNNHENFRMMKENHLVSIIRRDFIEKNGNYPGLSDIIRDYLRYLMKNSLNFKEKGVTIPNLQWLES